MPTASLVYASKDAWRAAGRPEGGIFPVSARERADAKAQDNIPDRYDDGRPLYWIVLPGGALWCPWFRSYSADPSTYRVDGWDISGTIPSAMTISPAVATPTYSGSVTAGSLS